MGKRRVGAGQGRATGCLGWPAPDPRLAPGRVGLARAFPSDALGSVFFALGWVLGRKPWPAPNPSIVAGHKSWPVPTQHVAWAGSGQVGSGGP